ncbi:MAG: ABC transporter permease [Vicinamibacterales bacterium]
MSELRLAIRRLWKRPAATLASIITLGAAIGAAVAMWTVLNALLVRPLAVHDPSTLVTVTVAHEPEISDAFVYNTYRDAADHHPFAALAGWGEWGAPIRDHAGERPGEIHFVSQSYFDTLGIQPAIGRQFTADDDRPGAPLVALLSHRYWDRSFARNQDVLGSTVQVGRKPATIVGVAPRGFRGLDLTSSPDLFMPLHVVEDVQSAGNFLQQARAKGFSPNAWISIVGRVAAGASHQDMAARLSAVPVWSHPKDPKPQVEALDASALPRRDRASVVRFTRMLSMTVGLLLVAGCGTVALLLLVRTEERRLEFATCRALGASRTRLVKGVAMEGALMAAGGAILSVPAGIWLFSLLESYSLPGGVPLRDLVLDIRGTGITIAALGAVIAALFVVLVATASGFSEGLSDALKVQASSQRSRPRTRAALITAQIAIAVVLLAGTALFIRSLSAAVSVNADHDASKIVTARFPLRPPGYTPDRIRAFHDQVVDRLSGNEAVARVAVISDMNSMGRGGRMTIDGEPRVLPALLQFTALHGPYFETLDLAVVEGRSFGPEESLNSPMVGVVSESFARFLGGGDSAIGHRVRMPFRRAGSPFAEVTVVGVVEDFITSVRQLQPFTLYMPAVQHLSFSTPNTLVVLAAGDAASATREILAVGRAIDPVPAARIATLKDSLYAQMQPQQLGATVLGALGLIAALLTMLGLYVIAESTAAQRTRELGIRAALGATRRDLRTLLVRDNLRLATIGALAGLAIVYAGAGTIRAFLFGVEAFDPLTLTAVPSAIVVIAVLVGLGPAVRASRADIAQVLRRE